MRRAFLILLFFISGASGLIYQVIWVRQFGNVFGNTVHSASLVTAVFMCGLGVGALAAGVWADRHFSADSTGALRAYAFVEIAIGIIGLLLAGALPHLGDVSAWISSYEPGARGWHELSTSSSLFRYAVAVALLAPITLLMGGTLTLLIRHIVAHEVDEAGWRIGALYGANTAGAALGCFLTDFWLVPGMGLFATQGLAVAFNLVAGLGALRLAGRSTQVSTALDRSPAPPVSRTMAFTAVAIALTGFAGMAMEIVWFRHLMSVFGPFRSSFSLLLTVILLGIWLGSTAGGYAHKKLGNPAVLYAASQAGFVAAALVSLGRFERADFPAITEALGAYRDVLGGWLWKNSRHLAALATTLVVVGPTAFFMGVSFPLANANVHRAVGTVGRRAGALYLANTLGGVLGAVLAGFVLLPRLGLQTSVLVVAVSSVGAIVALLATVERSGARIAAFGCALGVGLGSVAYWRALPSDHMVRQAIPGYARTGGSEVVKVEEGVNETIVVTRHPEVGNRLITNGFAMSSTRVQARRYMRAFSHIPLLSHENPKNALVICFGVGSTLHAASLHPTLERLEIVDLSRDVLRHAEYFEAANHGVLGDPRVRVFVNDGRQHLRMTDRRYDLITAEPPPIDAAGIASLYSVEFFTLARSRLAEGGMITYWLPAYQVVDSVNRAIVRAFTDVFPQSILLSGESAELILMGINGDALVMDAERIAARLDANPRVQADLRNVYLGTLTELLGTYAGSASTLRRAVAHSPPVTDDYPIMEYGSSILLRKKSIPPELFDTRDIDRHCRGCDQIAGLATYLEILGRRYASAAFLGTGGGDFEVKATPEVERVVAGSLYLRFLFGTAQADFARAEAQLATGDPRAVAALEDVLLLDPAHEGARLALARATMTATKAR